MPYAGYGSLVKKLLKFELNKTHLTLFRAVLGLLTLFIRRDLGTNQSVCRDKKF